ncbi:MAG: TldD/PmbA family protein [Candidatus Thorarchaeota archaeon]|jgi:predicted Zn-dependent protease
MENNKDLLQTKTQLILKEAETLGASQAQATITLTSRALTRLANSIIDQNVAEKHAKVRIVVYFNQKNGSVEFEVIDDNEIKQAVEQAVAFARISPENKDFKSLPSPKPYASDFDVSSQVCETTHNTTPEKRAELAKLAIDTAHDVDSRVFAVAGYVQNITVEKTVANSLGIDAYEMRTYSSTEMTVLAKDDKEETAGWANDARRDVSELKVENVARTAAEKAANGFGLKYLDPGEYELVLEPAAAGDLAFYTTYIGFGARRYQEYMSFLRDRIGEQMFSEKLDMWDNPLDQRLVGASLFDDEGVPHQRVDLVDNGVVKNLVYDNLTATKDGVESTGNHAKMWGPAGPFARHIIVGEGNSSLEEMISETKRGVLVTHFHYMNTVNPTEGVLTALTRDGAWIIENGEVKHPLHTLRFTDAIPRFFKEIEMIGKYPDFLDIPPMGKVPAMKLPSFMFSGSSKE